VYPTLGECLEGYVTSCPLYLGEEGTAISEPCPFSDNFIGKECTQDYNDYSTFRLRAYYCSDGKLKKYGFVADEKDGKTYRTVEIGNQVWMAENLNYIVLDRNDKALGDNRCSQTTQAQIRANPYADQNNLCSKLGRYYKWATAMALDEDCNTGSSYCESDIDKIKHKGLCPKGWHIPNKSEAETLFSIASATDLGAINQLLVLDNQSYWTTSSIIPNPTDKFGFSALQGGYMSTVIAGTSALTVSAWWLNSPDKNDESEIFYTSNQNLTNIYPWSNDMVLPIRCIKD
jgi:uncharacterized protein (TIGR02145 family)